MASLRASDTAPPAITALSKDNHGGILVSDIEQGTFRFTADDVQKLGPSVTASSLHGRNSRRQYLAGHTRRWPLFSYGRASHQGQCRIARPKDQLHCWRSVKSCGSAPTQACITGTAHGFRRLELPSSLGNVQVLSILRDRDSNIWVGTTRGLLRISGKGISFSEEKELRGDGGINALFEDREGNLWIGGARGLGRIRDSAFVTYSSVSDRRFEHNGPVYVDPEGRTWFAPAQGGLYVLAEWPCSTRCIDTTTMRSSIPSVEGQMWCGPDANAGD